MGVRCLCVCGSASDASGNRLGDKRREQLPLQTAKDRLRTTAKARTQCTSNQRFRRNSQYPDDGMCTHRQCQTQYPPPPLCISYALVQATVAVGTVIIVYIIQLCTKCSVAT